MTGIPDALVEKAARAMHVLLDLNDRWDEMVDSDRESYREMVRPSLLAIGLPALLERVEAAEGHAGPDADLAAARRLYEWVAEIREAEADPDWDDLDVMAQAAWLQGARHVGTDALAAKVAAVEAVLDESRTLYNNINNTRTVLVREDAIRAALTEGTEGT